MADEMLAQKVMFASFATAVTSGMLILLLIALLLF